MSIAEYAELDALGLAELVRRGEVTAAELVEAAIARIEQLDGTLNAVVHRAFDLADEAAAHQPAPGTGGPLQGVPMLLKDVSADCTGMPTTFACRALAERPPSRHDRALVRRFKTAGLIPLGKTNAPEWGLLPTTEPALYGPTHNPWARGISPGGSSGGSAAAVAAGMVPVAHANDGGGSTRIPASACGLVGLKPSRGRISWGPQVGEVIDGFTCEGVVTRSVRDTAVVLDEVAGPEPGEPYVIAPPARSYLDETRRRPRRLRIAFWDDSPLGTEVHPECRKAVARAARLCAALGHEVEEAVPQADLAGLLASWMTTYHAATQMSVDTLTPMIAGRPAKPGELEPLSLAMAEKGRALSALDWQLAAGTRQGIARAIGRFHEEYDIWLTPVMAAPPAPHGAFDGTGDDADAYWEKALAYIPFTPIQNATGQPSISLPLHWTGDGLPVGVMFTSAIGEDGLLLSLAAQLEEAAPWHDRRPPLAG